MSRMASTITSPPQTAADAARTERIRRLVADAPTLTSEQRDQLRPLLQGQFVNSHEQERAAG